VSSHMASSEKNPVFNNILPLAIRYLTIFPKSFLGAGRLLQIGELSNKQIGHHGKTGCTSVKYKSSKYKDNMDSKRSKLGRYCFFRADKLGSSVLNNIQKRTRILGLTTV
jgi:hypothetical protein